MKFTEVRNSLKSTPQILPEVLALLKEVASI